MLTEALEFLQGTFRRAEAPTVVTQLTDHEKVTYAQNGSIARVDLKPKPRAHRFQSIESFCSGVDRYAQRLNPDVSIPEASIWISHQAIVCVIDDEQYRVNTLTLPIEPNPVFATLKEKSELWQSQKKMIDVCRHDLQGCQITPGNTLPLLRNLKFTTSSEAEGRFTNSSVALGKSFESKVTGEAELPDTIAIEFHPYPSMADQITRDVVVYCTLFTDAGAGTLKLTPQPGQLDDAERIALEAIEAHLVAHEKTKDVPIFIGTP